MTRVVITGVGLATALGPDAGTCWKRLVAGENGIRRISFWDPRKFSDQSRGEGARDASGTRAGIASGQPLPAARPADGPVAQEAFRDAGLDPRPIATREIGLSLGMSVNYLDMRLLKEYFRLLEPGQVSARICAGLLERGDHLPDYPFFRRQGDTMASVLSRLLKIGGPTLTNDTACAASAYAVGDAFHMIRRGRVRAMLAGGAAALVSPFSVLAFAVIGALEPLGGSRNGVPPVRSPARRIRDGRRRGRGASGIARKRAGARRPHLRRNYRVRSQLERA